MIEPVRLGPQMRETLLVLAAIAAVAAAIAFLKVVPGINPTTAGFALLMLVLLSATIAPLWIAITVAVASTLSFNYFFFPPVGTFAIAEPHNWVSLSAFLVTALIGSHLSAAAQERARIAVERAQLVEAREATEIQRQRGELAATLLASLSHDLKTPLTVIQTAIDNLRDELPEETRRAQAEAAAVELRRLKRLFEEILDMARIDAAAIPVAREWVTPADVVDAAVAHVRHAIGGHSLLVEADAERAVQIDARLASIALSHLIENAARYSPATRDIVVNARAADDGIHITVTDQGPGIEPGDLDHLFERFYRGHRAQQTAPGSGMGLAISRGLLTAIGGRVWAENAPGAGAQFSIEIAAPTRPVDIET
jgi:two-component system, OmpR family, sensor histidine kinase KdpD